VFISLVLDVDLLTRSIIMMVVIAPYWIVGIVRSWMGNSGIVGAFLGWLSSFSFLSVFLDLVGQGSHGYFVEFALAVAL
jgi:hypothetical protein